MHCKRARAIRSPRRHGRAATAVRSRPSALAVLRLITSSYLVGACTGKSAGFCALEDAVDVASRTPKLVEEIRPIRNQSAGGDIIAFLVDRGQLVLGGKSDDQITMDRRQRACRQDQTTIRGLREGCDLALNLARRPG